MKRCIVSIGIGGIYGQEVRRIESAVRAVGETADVWAYTSYPQGCPRHEDIPFGFKPWLMKQAQAEGYEQVIWFDSKVYPRISMDPIWLEIEKEGHLVIRDGWNVGQWCVDPALKTLGITREQAWEIAEIWAPVIGLDLRNQRSVTFLDEWYRLSQDGITFHGLITIHKPYDPQVNRLYGHRHDQTAASVLLWRLGMKLNDAPAEAERWLSEYVVAGPGRSETVPNAILLSQRGL